MPIFFRQSNRRSRDAVGRSISRISSIARSVPSMTKSCVHAKLTRSESRMLAIRDGIPFALPHRRASLTIFQPSRGSLSLSQTTHTAGMAQWYCFIWSVMDAGIAGSWLARQSSGEPLFSFCSTWLRQEQHTLTSIAAPMIYFRHLRFGQMRVQSPNCSLGPTAAAPSVCGSTGRFAALGLRRRSVPGSCSSVPR